MISVVIPTRDRPHYLREALESVRGQTARQAITEVIVSENGTGNESEIICNEFGDLPIVYLQQKPPLPVLLHFNAVFQRVRSPFMAFLHDDDWWAPEYLATALGALIANQHGAAVFSNHYETYGPHHPCQITEKAWRVWIASGCDFGSSLLWLDEVSVMLSCLLDATFHYSTAVVRRDALLEAFSRVLASGNAYDNDRLFPVHLSSQGLIGYLTAPAAFVRVHPEQDSMQPRYLLEHWVLKSETTKWLLATEPKLVALAVEKFNKTASSLQPIDMPSHGSLLQRIACWLGDPQRTTLIQECGLNLPPLQPSAPSAQPPRNLKWLLKQLCPPVFLAMKRRLVARMTASRTKPSYHPVRQMRPESPANST